MKTKPLREKRIDAVRAAMVWSSIHAELRINSELMTARAKTEDCAHVALDLELRNTTALFALQDARNGLRALDLSV